MQALGVFLLVADDLLGAGVELFLGEAERLAELVSGYTQAGVGLAQFRSQFHVFLLGVGQFGLLRGEAAAQRGAPDETADGS